MTFVEEKTKTDEADLSDNNNVSPKKLKKKKKNKVKAAPSARPQSEIVDLFWLIADEDEKVRQASIYQLCCAYSSAAEETRSYILKRLIGGLASDRDLARPAFAVAVDALLASSNVGTVQIISLLDSELEVEGSPKERRNAALARVSAYSALLHSGCFSPHSPHLKQVLSGLTACACVDRAVAKIAGLSLTTFVEQTSSASSFKDSFWPSLIPFFKKVTDKSMVESLTLLFTCYSKYPIAVKKRAKADLGLTLDLTSSYFWSSEPIVGVFNKAVTEFSMIDNTDDSKALFKSAADVCSDSLDSFNLFWTNLICGQLCSSKDKNGVLLTLLAILIERVASKEHLSVLLQQRSLNTLAKCHQLLSKNPLRLAANKVVEALVGSLANPLLNDDVKLVIIETFLNQESRMDSVVARLLSAAPDKLSSALLLT